MDWNGAQEEGNTSATKFVRSFAAVPSSDANSKVLNSHFCAALMAVNHLAVSEVQWVVKKRARVATG